MLGQLRQGLFQAAHPHPHHHITNSSIQPLSVPPPGLTFTRGCPVMALGLGLSVPSCTHSKGPLCKYPFLGAVGVWMATLCSHSLGARPPSLDRWGGRVSGAAGGPPAKAPFLAAPWGGCHLAAWPPPSALQRATARLLCLFTA